MLGSCLVSFRFLCPQAVEYRAVLKGLSGFRELSFSLPCLYDISQTAYGVIQFPVLNPVGPPCSAEFVSGSVWLGNMGRSIDRLRLPKLARGRETANLRLLLLRRQHAAKDSCSLIKGPYLYDVRTGWGRWVPKKQTKGTWEGVQKSEKFADVVYGRPLKEMDGMQASRPKRTLCSNLLFLVVQFYVFFS